MELRKFITTTVYEQMIKEEWFHGTPDKRELEAAGGFTYKAESATYIKNLKKYYEHMQKIHAARENGDEDLYFKLLDKVNKFQGEYVYPKPLFLTDEKSVAETYADEQRAWDYQNAKSAIYNIDVDCQKVATIYAYGDRFRFISVKKVKDGFIKSGIQEQKIDEVIAMFNYYVSDDKGIKTDVLAAIGNWLGFDCIDVVGVLDSYHGGNIKSTVRIVLDPTKVKIRK